MDWQAATRLILERLDLKAEYAALGVAIAADKPTPAGWLSCRVFRADQNGDRNPSAGVNVAGEHPKLGRYKEFTGEGRNVSFFEFAATVAGKFATWQEARQHYAGKTGVKLPGGSTPKTANDSLVLRGYNARQVNAWCQLRPPIAEPVARAAGMVTAGWPASDQRFTVVAMPIYGAHLTDDDPTGWMIWNKTGRPLPLFRKKGEKPTPKKMLMAGGSTSGWMNRDGLERLDQAEIVWKTEGPGDCLALASVIPAELCPTHVVISNSGGSREKLAADFWDGLAGKTVYVVHDCDEDGQVGGLEQASLAATVAAEVRHITLPYEIVPNHGKDVRDFLTEGHSYQDLLDLAAAAPVIEPPAAEEPDQSPARSLEQDREICESIGLDVLGERPNREILVYSQGKIDVITKIASLTHNDLLQIAGPIVRERVHTSNDAQAVPIGSTHFNRVREAIAVLAGQQRLQDQSMHGAGCWRGTGGQLVLVGTREAAVWDTAAGELTRILRPKAAGLLLEMAGSDPWYDFEALSKHLGRAADPVWRQQALDELAEILGRWRWQAGPGTASLLVGLVLATWIQTAWRWRPHVALTGESAAGKSTLLEVLSGIFGPLTVLASKPSEAGLRQKISHRASAILIDEFETDRHRARVLELLRTSSSGSRILRGTPGQGGIEFGLRHICWVAAIEVGTDRQPDRNRYLALEMLPPTLEAIRKFRLPASDALADLGQRLLAIAVWCSGPALKLTADLRSRQLDGYDPRTVESLAVPAAMLAVAMGQDPGDVLSFCAQQIEEDRRHHEPDQVQLMHAVLSSTVTLDRGRIMSVAQLLAATAGDFPGDAWDALERVGVAVAANSRGPREFVSSREILFLEPKAIGRYLLAGTRWAEQSLDQILLRLPTAERGKCRINGTRPSGIKIDWEAFERQFLGSDEETETLP